MADGELDIGCRGIFLSVSCIPFISASSFQGFKYGFFSIVR